MGRWDEPLLGSAGECGQWSPIAMAIWDPRVGGGQLKACLSLLWLKSFWLTSKKGLNSLIFRGEGCHGKEEGQRKAWEVVGIS